MNIQHPYYLRLHEGLNLVSLLLDEIRKNLVAAEHNNLSFLNTDEEPFLKYEDFITAIGLALLKEKYLENIRKLDEYIPKYRPALKSSYQESLEQIDTLFGEINDGILILAGSKTLALDKLECSKDLSHQGRDSVKKPDPFIISSQNNTEEDARN